ncbi:hypothetical protein D1B33_08760 [Lysinibacillus yapensis]|uniref:DUF3592 domain-containing protein n=1 Tax=Ureibacillus yapensis TaxID=2304605 RepID=A0A396SGK6_9BACL|nr:hypothetical protein [Lysinibacillus yapensis]RHW37606.1 hypothetical protein D1B33_08760 [Lysinibacillus yapensis]
MRPENRYEGQIIKIETRKYWDSTAGAYKEGRFGTVEIQTKEDGKKHVDIYVSNFDVPIGTKIDEVYYNPDVYNYAVIPDRDQQRQAFYVSYLLSLMFFIGGIYFLLNSCKHYLKRHSGTKPECLFYLVKLNYLG